MNTTAEHFIAKVVDISARTAASTYGHNGVVSYEGFVSETENNVALIGEKRWRTYRDIMLNVSVVAMGVRHYLHLITRPEWKAEPAKQGEEEPTEEAKRLARWTEDVLNGMDTSWRSVVRRQAMDKYWGFVIQEWTTKKREDGTIGILDIAHRPQPTITRWKQDKHGRVEGCYQTHPTTGEEIYLPLNKIIYSVEDSLTDDPRGVGLFRHLVAPSKRLEKYQQLEAFGFLRELRGIPKGFAPYAQISEAVDAGKITAEDAKRMTDGFEEFVKNAVVASDTGITMDSDVYHAGGENQAPSSNRKWDIELLSGDGANLDAINTAIERVSHDMARIMGVENLLLGGGAGSQALSKDKSQNFGLVVQSALNDLRELFQDHLIAPLWKINAYPKELMPTLTTGTVQSRSVEEITAAIQDLATAGAVLAPDDPVIGEVRRLLGLSSPVTVMTPAELMNPGPSASPVTPTGPQNLSRAGTTSN